MYQITIDNLLNDVYAQSLLRWVLHGKLGDFSLAANTQYSVLDEAFVLNKDVFFLQQGDQMSWLIVAKNEFLAAGATGEVFSAISFQHHAGLIYSLGNTSYVIKSVASESRSACEELEHEYKIAQTLSYLEMRKLSLANNYSSLTLNLVMNRFPGMPLSQWLREDEEKSILTFEQKILLALALARKLKEQIIDQGIVHLDIKPDNVICSWENSYTGWIINFIDFNTSQLVGSTELIKRGTLGYRAFEYS